MSRALFFSNDVMIQRSSNGTRLVAIDMKKAIIQQCYSQEDTAYHNCRP